MSDTLLHPGYSLCTLGSWAELKILQKALLLIHDFVISCHGHFLGLNSFFAYLESEDTQRQVSFISTLFFLPLSVYYFLSSIAVEHPDTGAVAASLLPGIGLCLFILHWYCFKLWASL